MDVARIKELLFRHIEKIVLTLVILFVGYRVYLNLFPPEVVQPARRDGQPAPPPMPGKEIDASFWQTASPFLCPPSIKLAKYNWFYPPKTHWAHPGTGVALVEDTEGQDRGRVFVRRKVRRRVDGSPEEPQVTTLTEEERATLNLPLPEETLADVCQISVGVVPAAPGEPPGDVLDIKAVKAGRWARVMVMLENQDRFCVPVIVAKKGTILKSDLALGTIADIKENPLGTVVIRFTAPQGSIKRENEVITHIEPTYFEIRRKGERDKEEIAIGRVPGRNQAPAEPGAGPGPAPAPKAVDTTGFPGAAKQAPPPKAKAAPPTKGAPTTDTGEMVFEDMDAEAEVAYAYRIRSVLIPRQEGDEVKERFGEPVSYKTLPRFTFAYFGGDAQHASIRVYIGPRENPQGSREYERIPIGGWVGEVPKEFRGVPEAPEDASPEPAKAAPAPPEAKGAAPEPAEGPSARFVTRYVLVAIEQGVFRPVLQNTRRPVPDGRGGVKVVVVKTYRETQDRRIILRDPKNRLHYLWIEREQR